MSAMSCVGQQLSRVHSTVVARWVPHLILAGAIITVVAGFPVAAGQGEEDAPEKPSEADIETPADLPDIGELPEPTASEILLGPPADWIVVEQIRVLRVEPVAERPDTLEVLDQRVAAVAARKPRNTDQQALARWRADFEKAHDLEVSLIEDPTGQPFWIHSKHIDQIIHHDTHAINAAARHRDAGDFGTARELLQHVRRRAPEWPGLFEATNRLLFAEAESMLERGQVEHALVILQRLFERDRDYPQLQLRFGQAIRAIGLSALRDANPRRCRYFTERLRAIYPKHTVIRELDTQRRQKAIDLLATAQTRRSMREASELVDDAARYAPELPDLRAAHERLYKRYPILHVGALETARPSDGSVIDSTANMRYSELTTSRLFEPASVEGDLVRYRSDWIETWTPEELGRRATLEFPEAQSGIDAFAVANALTKAIENPVRFGDRFANCVHGVRPVSPTRLELALAGGPLRLDALLAATPIQLPGQFVLINSPELDDADRFRHATDSVSFQTTASRLERSRGQFVEIVEHRYATEESFGRAIRRGEIRLAIDVPPSIVGRLVSENWFAKEVILSKTQLPLTHILQFRPDCPAARSTPLRVALERAIDRQVVLPRAFLHAESRAALGGEFVRPTANLFPGFSYANEQTVAPRAFAPAAAIPLGLLAKRALGGQWQTLKMITPDHLAIRDAAQQMVDQWRDLGFPVELVPLEQNRSVIESGSWDIAYRVISMAEPSVELWPFLANDGQPSLGSINYLPEPLRQRLSRLDNTRDWPMATRLLHEAHRSILDQAIVIPLWEIDRISIRHRSIRGVPDDRILTPYQDIDRWRVEPVFSLGVD